MPLTGIMSNFFTLEEILLKSWDYSNDRYHIPGKECATGYVDYSISDIRIWEKIYKKPGAISVYAAWDPYTEYYIIVHELHKHCTYGLESFYGAESQKRLILRLSEFGIQLPTTRIQVNSDYYWLNDLTKSH